MKLKQGSETFPGSAHSASQAYSEGYSADHPDKAVVQKEKKINLPFLTFTLSTTGLFSSGSGSLCPSESERRSAASSRSLPPFQEKQKLSMCTIQSQLVYKC